jgi:hypothetical protein
MCCTFKQHVLHIQATAAVCIHLARQQDLMHTPSARSNAFCCIAAAFSALVDLFKRLGMPAAAATSNET